MSEHDISPEEIASWRKLAAMATQGPWLSKAWQDILKTVVEKDAAAGGHIAIAMLMDWPTSQVVADADYISTFGPPTIKRILAFVELAVKSKERMFPLQAGYSRDARPGPLSIPWSIAEKAYGVYAAKFGRGQTLEVLAQRGGFGTNEMDMFYPSWRQEVDEITALKAERDRLRLQVENHCERIAAQSALLSKRAESQTPTGD